MPDPERQCSTSVRQIDGYACASTPWLCPRTRASERASRGDQARGQSAVTRVVSTGNPAVTSLSLSWPLTVSRRDSASPATPVPAEGHASGSGDDSLVDAQVG